MTTVLIVDDHPMYRAGLVAALAPVDGIEVIAEADDGETAVTLAGQLQPDVILMDLTMPGLGGVAATRAITDEYPTIAVLVLTMSEAGDSIWAALRAGARGYLVKGSTKTEIANAIAVAASDGMVFGPAVAERLQTAFRSNGRAPDPFPDLTEREAEILRLIARGRNNAQVAAALTISHKTVRNHLYNIFTKLQVHSRTEAMERAVRAGLNDDQTH